MFCKNCGTELKPDTIFCHNCGIKVEQETQQSVIPVQTAPEVQQPVTPVQIQLTIPQDPGKGLGIAALVLGIISLVLGIFCPCFASCLGGIIPLVCGILGIIFGAKGSSASKKAGFDNTCAKAGLILSIVGVSVTVLFCAFYFLVTILEEAGATTVNPSI